MKEEAVCSESYWLAWIGRCPPKEVPLLRAQPTLLRAHALDGQLFGEGSESVQIRKSHSLAECIRGRRNHSPQRPSTHHRQTI